MGVERPLPPHPTGQLFQEKHLLRAHELARLKAIEVQPASQAFSIQSHFVVTSILQLVHE
jgi:hypothetical protein